MAFDGKYFSLTPRILRLGYAFLASSSLPTLLQPFLERISVLTGESCSAAVLDDRDVLYVARSARTRIMSIGLGVGSRLPAYCTALGRVLLAQQSPEWLAVYFASVPLRPLTERTITTEAALRVELERISAQGYALVDEELEVGLRSIAIPVFAASGELICGVNVSAQSSRVSVSEMEDRLLPVLQDCLRDIAGILP
jgi:IclR family pca regulon transcriptional regulator